MNSPRFSKKMFFSKRAVLGDIAPCFLVLFLAIQIKGGFDFSPFFVLPRRELFFVGKTHQMTPLLSSGERFLFSLQFKTELMASE